jgi:V/A-type H+-transporting ATPase subunit I
MIYKTAESHASFGERLIIVLVETLEAIMGNVSNTLSFLRVAAFSLNHVALMLAVFALANMMDTVGYWTMVVFGNVFVIVLEGAIVTIQTLRLEYFEGFSRFYSGDGREFRPLSLERGRAAPEPTLQTAS